MPSLLSPKERYLVFAAFLIIAFSALSWFVLDRIFNYTTAPDDGGSYSEALIGQPRFINPILSEGSDVDRDLTSIIYSGLMKYTADGKLTTDLASSFEVSQDGLEYTFWLKTDVLWHDGRKFNADDVVFTINTLENPDYKSPLRVNWQNIRVEKLDDFKVKFILNQPYAPFLESTTIGILPAHIWSDVSVKNFSLAEPNLAPIGTGPYVFNNLVKDGTGFIRSVELGANKNYHGKKPYIQTLTLNFYETENEAIAGWNNGEVMGLSFFSLKNQKFLKNQDSAIFHKILLPRFFAIFFNQSQHKALADKNVRLALQYAINKKEILREVAGQNALIANSPIFNSSLNKETQSSVNNTEEAKKILDDAKWIDEDNDGIREKKIDPKEDATRLSFTLAVPATEELRAAAELIKKQWAFMGVETNLEVVDLTNIQNIVIKSRNYQMLLFGEVSGIIPDLYAFWHSSQKRDPGINLALYDNKEVDKLIEDARIETNPSQRQELINRIENSIVNDVPAIFLYNPYYLYLVDKEVRGINIQLIPSSAQRFIDIENWYIDTKRVRK